MFKLFLLALFTGFSVADNCEHELHLQRQKLNICQNRQIGLQAEKTNMETQLTGTFEATLEQTKLDMITCKREMQEKTELVAKLSTDQKATETLVDELRLELKSASGLLSSWQSEATSCGITITTMQDKLTRNEKQLAVCFSRIGEVEMNHNICKGHITSLDAAMKSQGHDKELFCLTDEVLLDTAVLKVVITKNPFTFGIFCLLLVIIGALLIILCVCIGQKRAQKRELSRRSEVVPDIDLHTTSIENSAHPETIEHYAESNIQIENDEQVTNIENRRLPDLPSQN